jgi:septal ring factor EnvC (AmiA/AmiB activator)
MLGKKKDPQDEIDRIRKEVEDRLTDAMNGKSSMTPQERDELKAMIAAAGIAGSALKAGQTIKKAGGLGDKMHQQTLDMIEKAHEQALKNPRPPTIDPQKLIDASDRLQKLIEKENEERDKRLKKLAEESKKLKKASEELLKTAERQRDELRDKNMTRAREQQQEADWRKQGCPVTKPVTVGKPLKLKKPAA